MKAMKRPIAIDVYVTPRTMPWCLQPLWLTDAITDGKVQRSAGTGGGFVVTKEGKMAFAPGDIIAKGVRGELYPIAAEIFHETYDIIEP